MNRRNLFLLAVLWARLVLGLPASPPALDQGRLAGLLYFPAIAIAVLPSHHHAHVPEGGPIWVGAVIWSLVYLERQRRTYWLLAPIPLLDLEQALAALAHAALAHAALQHARGHRAVRGMLVHFERALQAHNGQQRATEAMAQMHAEAARQI